MCWASPRPVTTMQIKLLNESKHIVNMHRIARGLSYAYRSSGKYMSSLCFKMVLELRLTRERKLTKKKRIYGSPVRRRLQTCCSSLLRSSRMFHQSGEAREKNWHRNISCTFRSRGSKIIQTHWCYCKSHKWRNERVRGDCRLRQYQTHFSIVISFVKVWVIKN